MAELLVTGGTGTLGVPTVDALRRDGHSVRVLSRRTGEGRVSGNLTTGQGLRAAVDGVDTVVHLATSASEADIGAAGRLIAEAEDAGVRHIVFISIVGIEEIPLSYYRAKLDVERMLEASTVPHTILRATQFHDFVTALFSYQRTAPWLFVPRVGAQTIDTRDVAARLAELVRGGPAGRVDDIGGPERLTIEQYARRWKAAAHDTRRVVTMRFPGKMYAALRRRANMVPGTPYGTTGYSEFLAQKYS